MGFVTKFFAFWNENPRFVVEEKWGFISSLRIGGNPFQRKSTG